MLSTMAIGCLSLFIGSMFQLLLPMNTNTTILSLLYSVLVRNAFTEELGRLITFWLILVILPIMGQSRTIPQTFTMYASRDIMIYRGVLAGFVFAMIENISYGLLNLQLVIIRTITSAPLHAACSARIALVVYYGWSLGTASQKSKNIGKALFYGISAILIHGFYNLLLLFSAAFAVIPIAIACIALISVLALTKIDRKDTISQ
ncbi:PrsW family glutamic-type intramembrane protease [Gracilinema caldarium]|nr:PrsW family glutamic-type intramembrane protease [Gracilinema caldarium]